MLGTEPGKIRPGIWTSLSVTLSVSLPASPLGMPHGAATFMGTCSREGIGCASGVSVPQALEGEGSVTWESGWGGGLDARGLGWV